MFGFEYWLTKIWLVRTFLLCAKHMPKLELCFRLFILNTIPNQTFSFVLVKETPPLFL